MANYVDLPDNITSSIGSIGTESDSLSVTSSFNNQKQAGGFWPFGTSDDINEIALLACKKQEFSTVSFLIRENKITDFSTQDSETGYTLLHYIVAYYKLIPHVEDVVDVICKQDDTPDFINIQDNVNGNTPLHLCVMTNNFDLCNKLIKAGADPKIRNSKKLFVASDTECDVTEKQARPPTIIVQQARTPSPSGSSVFIKKQNFSETPSEDTIDREINRMVNVLLNAEKSKQHTEMSISHRDMPDRLTDMSEKFNGHVDSQSDMSKLVNTSEFINDLVTAYTRNPNNNPSTVTVVNPLIGGGSNTIKGQRRIKTYSDYSFSESANLRGGAVGDDDADVITSSDDDSDSDSNSVHSELSRSMHNQTNVIHDRTVEKIKSLMNVDDKVARVYKSELYYKVKKEHPELNGYDRAIEMEKLATEDVLKKIDIGKAIKNYDERKAESDKQKSSSQSEEKQKKPKKESKNKKESETSELSETSSEKPKKKRASKTTSETSQNSVITESNFSETSEFVF